MNINEQEYEFITVEKKRKKLLLLFFLPIPFVLISFFLLLLDIMYHFNNIMFLHFFAGSLVAAPFVMFKAVKDYKKIYKSIIIPSIVKSLTDLEYSNITDIGTQKIYTRYKTLINKSIISFNDLYNSSLFLPFNTVISNDCFSGKYKEVDILISEVDIRSKELPFMFFIGSVILLDFNSNFTHNIVGYKSSFLSFIKNNNNFLEINLEDTSLKKGWKIYSDNEIEAKSTLTIELLKSLENLKEKFKAKKIEFSMFNNKFVIKIKKPSGEDLFTTSSIFKNVTKKKHITEVLEQFLSILAIVDILKLNQRIGM